MKRFAACFAFSILLVLSSHANATLLDRGNGMIYDDFLDITWLFDANYVLTNSYGVSYDSTGRMHWADATQWVNSLEYGGYDDWRLPDASSTASDSEMYYMFYTNLGGTGSIPISSSHNSSNYALFVNIQDRSYASESDFDDSRIYDFNLGNAAQSTPGKDTWFYAWAVRDGDSTPVPEPSTLFLLGARLLAMAGLNRKICSNR